jgi:acyl-CoA thioester hydrolase
MTVNGWHERKIRVRYKDTDQMGVIYYGNYLTFFEVGRSEYLRDLGFPYSSLEVEGYFMAVTEAYAKYHANVGYDSLITVKTKVSGLKNASVRFEYEVVDEDYELLVSGYTIHACMNSNHKPTRIPSRLRKIIEENLKPL